MFALLWWGIEYKSLELMMQLYRTLMIKLYLEFCTQFWSPHYRKHLQSVQKRFTSLMRELGVISYREKDRLGMFTLERQ